MRIAIIADPIDNQKGGVHVYTRELVAHLLRQEGGHAWFLVRERRDPSLQGVRQIVIPNIRIGLGLAALRLFMIVPLVLWWYRVDAVFEPAHFGPFNLPRRIRRITMIHDLTPLLYPQYHRFHSQLLQKIFLKGILRRADLILANSRHTAGDIRRFFPETVGRITTILLGCEPAMRPAADRSRFAGRRVSDGYWLAVGTIEPRKNLVRLLEAYRIYREEHGEPADLVIVGQRGWKAEPFYEALQAHPYRADIHLTGYVSDEELAALYSHALALVYPSEYEGFGLPVLEAMACGCPVICSDVSSLPEVGGDVALYIRPFDVRSMVDAMSEVRALSGEERAALRRRCLERAALFSWASHARQWLAAVEGCVAGDPPPDDEPDRQISRKLSIAPNTDDEYTD
jgi:glycosyltransferase involved in cell wall biosynthesis